jgi:hypothetical protein
MKSNKVPARKLNKLHPNGQRSILLVRWSLHHYITTLPDKIYSEKAQMV